MYDNQTTILPERTTYGAFWPRVGAYMLDGLIVSTVVGLVINIAGSSLVTLGYYKLLAFYYLLFGVSFTLYYSILEASKAQATVGKMALNLKVTDMLGNRISFGRSLGRCLAKFLSTFLLFFGFIMVAWDSKKQGLHDKIAGTLVVKK